MKNLAYILLLVLIVSCVSSPKQKSPSKFSAEETRDLKRNMKLRFIWPVQKPILTSFFGWRSSKRVHEGIDLSRHSGRTIFASESGVVVHNSWIRGFGRAVIIQHKNDWSTLYAHLASSKVKRGQYVKQGTPLGVMGRTGRATGIHLHFEIRKGSDPLDPLLFLPPLKKGFR